MSITAAQHLALDAEATTIKLLPSSPLDEQLAVIDLNAVSGGVWLDFSKFRTVTSSELSELIRFSVRVRQRGKSIATCHVNPVVQEIFEITRFGRWSIDG